MAMIHHFVRGFPSHVWMRFFMSKMGGFTSFVFNALKNQTGQSCDIHVFVTSKQSSWHVNSVHLYIYIHISIISTTFFLPTAMFVVTQWQPSTETRRGAGLGALEDTMGCKQLLSRAFSAFRGFGFPRERHEDLKKKLGIKYGDDWQQGYSLWQQGYFSAILL